MVEAERVVGGKENNSKVKIGNNQIKNISNYNTNIQSVKSSSPIKYKTPYSQLSAKKKKELVSKFENGTMTRSEYKHFEWDRRFSNRRKRGVKRFWSEEKKKIKNNQVCTRNWTEQQKKDILDGKIPKYNNEPIEGHHKYNAIDYPQIADSPDNIYPATKKEHFERWHGGNYQNGTNGSPNNLGFIEEF